MKLNTEYNVDTSFTETEDFKIETSAKAFQILSGNIYKDVLLAVIRELSANAWDAHVSKGNTDVPFEIVVPTSLKPELIIKDYGVGLSDEAMRSLYKTYFGSDKTWTNELIGGLGLGSKTPFAYTDSFTVVSRFGGTATTYACFLNEKKTPSITRVSSRDCGDDTGLTITIPCKDTAGVLDKLKVLRWYPTKPIVFGGEIPELPPVLYKDPSVTVVADPDASYYYRKAKIYVVMGYVPYFVGALDQAKFGHIYYFHEKIGTYDPAASRETLTDVEPKMFKERVAAVDKLYIEEIGQLIDDPKLSSFEIIRLAQQNWGVLENHRKVEGIKTAIINAIEAHEAMLRKYSRSSDGGVSCISDLGKSYRRRWQINTDVLWDRIRARAQNSTSELHIVCIPPKAMHCKMVRVHFDDNVESVISIQTDKPQELRDELDAILGNGVCTTATDWPVSKATPTKRAKASKNTTTTVKYTSGAYQDIWIDKGDGVATIDYGDASKLDPNEYYVMYYSRRESSGSPRNHWAEDRITALAKYLPIEGILWVPDTELLKGRFDRLGFVRVEKGIEKRWSEIPRLHFNYEKLEALINEEYQAEQITLHGWHARRTKGHRLLTLGFKKFEDLHSRSKFSKAVIYFAPPLLNGIVDEAYKQDIAKFLARFRHKYPQHYAYQGKKLNDYMRYKDYEGSH